MSNWLTVVARELEFESCEYVNIPHDSDYYYPIVYDNTDYLDCYGSEDYFADCPY